MKYLTLTAAAALVLGLANGAAEANQPQAKAADNCPPAPKVHHHKPHAHHHHYKHAATPKTSHWTLFTGLKAGYGFGTAKLKDNDDLLGCGCGLNTDTSRTKMGSRGLVGGLLAGADYTFGSGFMLGLEADANLSHIQGKIDKRSVALTGVNIQNNFPIKDRVRAEGSFDFAARVGQNVCNAIFPYFKLGLSISRFKLQHHVQAYPVPFTNAFQISSYPLSKHKWRPGLQLGFGFDMPLHCNVFVGAEYAHTFYRKISTKTAAIVPGRVETATLRCRPSTDVITVRLTVRS